MAMDLTSPEQAAAPRVPAAVSNAPAAAAGEEQLAEIFTGMIYYELPAMAPYSC